MPVVYNVPTDGQNIPGAKRGKTQFTAQGCFTSNFGRNPSCFAGQEDELVVAASADHGLFIWSLPTDQQLEGDQIVDQSLVALRGHKDNIYSVRYNRQSDTLASAGAEKVIKLWTPIAQR